MLATDGSARIGSLLTAWHSIIGHCIIGHRMIDPWIRDPWIRDPGWP